MRVEKKFIGLCLILSAAVMPASVSAQMRSEEGRIVYEAAFFESFSPANALQMIERLPGFVLESGEMGVRGFGQAAGNVVINGQRPSSKSDSLATVLSRIPASRVLRIEIASGNSFGADYTGKSQVANIVLNEQSGIAGTLEAKMERESSGRIRPTILASAVLNRGVSSFSASFSLESMAYSEDGIDLVTELPSGRLVETSEVFSNSREPYKIASVGWAYELDEDESAHINASYLIDPWPIDQFSRRVAANGDVRDEIYRQDHIWHTYELSGDLTQPLLGGAIKLNALATRRDRANDDVSLTFDGADLIGGNQHLLDDRLEERVGRVSWTRDKLRGWTVEIGGEAAYNELTSETGLFSIDADDERTRIDLPIENAVISERRGELFARASTGLSSNLNLDLGVTYEYSELELTGDAVANRSLGFFKPNVALDWQPGAWQVSFSARRTVAQLEFGDFVSVAELNDGRVSGGNADLEPQRAWEFLLNASRPILGDGRVQIDLGHDRISKLQDRVPTEGGFDAPGNLGTGTRSFATLNVDIPLARIGIAGGRLSGSATYLDTSVVDPYTLEPRPFSGGPFKEISTFAYSAAFRQDFDTFAWGVDVKGATATTSFRRSELDKYQNINPNVSAFIEYRPTRQLTTSIGVSNLFDVPVKRWRDMYDPDRSVPAPFMREYRERNSHQLWYVSAKWVLD